jgi:hypothetical protein
MLKIKLFIISLVLLVTFMFSSSIGIFLARGSVVVYDSAPTPLVSFWLSDSRIRVHIPSYDTIAPYCSINRGVHGIRNDKLSSGGRYINVWYCP